MLTASKARVALRYNQRTGVFHWKYRADMTAQWNARYAGRIAGWKGKNGYYFITVDNVAYYAHRVAWLIIKGRWPKHDIDHKNRKPMDNRFCNFREATQSQNSRNTSAHYDSRIGLKGVGYCKGAHKSHRWYATICVNYKNKYLGLFPTPEAAHAAYKRAAKQFHGEFASAA